MANTTKGPGRPKTRTHEPVKGAARGTKEGEERYQVILKTADIQTAKDLAYWERLNIKELFAEMIADRKAKYERRNGPLRSRPNQD